MRCETTWTHLVVLVAAWLECALPARGQDTGFATDRPIEDRVRELEATVRRLEQVRPAPPAADAKPAVLAGWDEKSGFFLRSADQRFQLRVTGQMQADYRHFLDEVDTVDVPTFMARRARLGIEATVFQHFDFRLLPDFGRGENRIQDAYINVRYWTEAQFEAGKFKQPFSHEQLIQDRFVPTLERSLIDQLVPARDVGLMVHGQKLLGDRLDYGASVYGGVINGDQDTDKNKEAAGRVAVRPLRELGLPGWAEPLQLGFAGTFGNDLGLLAPATLRTPAGVPWFQFVPTARPDGARTRWSPEVAYVYGPLAVAAQFYAQDQELRAPSGRRAPSTVVDVSYRGGFLLIAYLLTGEERTTFSQPVTPLAAFDPTVADSGPGAWEVVGRVSWLELGADDPNAFGRLMDPARSAIRATELTLGINWYVNRWARVQFNWEHARFNNAVRLGPTAGHRLDHQNSLMTRFQIIF